MKTTTKQNKSEQKSNNINNNWITKIRNKVRDDFMLFIFNNMNLSLQDMTNINIKYKRFVFKIYAYIISTIAILSVAIISHIMFIGIGIRWYYAFIGVLALSFLLNKGFSVFINYVANYYSSRLESKTEVKNHE